MYTRFCAVCRRHFHVCGYIGLRRGSFDALPDVLGILLNLFNPIGAFYRLVFSQFSFASRATNCFNFSFFLFFLHLYIDMRDTEEMRKREERERVGVKRWNYVIFIFFIIPLEELPLFSEISA